METTNTAELNAVLADLGRQSAELFGGKISEAQDTGYQILGLRSRPSDPYLERELEDIVFELLTNELGDVDPDGIEDAADYADDTFNAHLAAGVARRIARARRWLLGC